MYGHKIGDKWKFFDGSVFEVTQVYGDFLELSLHSNWSTSSFKRRSVMKDEIYFLANRIKDENSEEEKDGDGFYQPGLDI